MSSKDSAKNKWLKKPKKPKKDSKKSSLKCSRKNKDWRKRNHRSKKKPRLNCFRKKKRFSSWSRSTCKVWWSSQEPPRNTNRTKTREETEISLHREMRLSKESHSKIWKMRVDVEKFKSSWTNRKKATGEIESTLRQKLSQLSTSSARCLGRVNARSTMKFKSTTREQAVRPRVRAQRSIWQILTTCHLKRAGLMIDYY